MIPTEFIINSFFVVINEDWSSNDLRITFTPSASPVTACSTFNITEDNMVECNHTFTVSFESIANCVTDPPIVSSSPSATVIITDNEGMKVHNASNGVC